MKLLFTFICILFVFTFAKAQHVIVTIKDTIEAQIISLDDSIYTNKRINKSRIVKTIDKKLVLRLVPIGENTLFDVFSLLTLKLNLVIRYLMIQQKVFYI